MEITVTSRAARRPLHQLGRKMSAGRLLVPRISDGTSFLGARAADCAVAKRVFLRQSCLWIQSPFPPQPTWWSPKGSVALSPTQRGHLDSPSLIFSPSQFLTPVIAGKNEHRLVLFAGKSKHHLELVDTYFTPTNFYVHRLQVKVHPGAHACGFHFLHVRTYIWTQPTVSIDTTLYYNRLSLYKYKSQKNISRNVHQCRMANHEK